MQKLALVCSLACSLFVSGCADLDVPDLNNPSIDELVRTPTPAGVAAASTGLIRGFRVDFAEASGYVAMLGILGRESYNFDGADPRYITEMLVAAQLDPGSPRFGGNFWNAPYSNIRNAHIVLDALEALVGWDNAQKEAARGFAKTLLAMEFLVVIVTRDENGAPIDVNRPLDGELAPIATKTQVYAHIATLLDQAREHLAAGGAAFPFPLPPGLKGFDTPATFSQFNRGLAARVAVYREDWPAALAALDDSFLTADPAAPALTVGVYIDYGTGAGDELNDLVDPNLFVHPSIVAEAETQMGGAVDARVATKITPVASRTVQDLTATHGFTLYPSVMSSVPVLRNEELILLRAEAALNDGDVAVSADDVNFIRVHSGGLEPRADLDANNLLEEILLQRRYSLLFEGGHRWIDARRTGTLESLPLDNPEHHRHAAFPLPVAETDARSAP